MPRGLVKRTAVPAALRTLLTVALACLPRPTISRRLAVNPAGACKSRVSLAPALYSPLASTAAAAAFTASSAVSSTGKGLASDAFEVWGVDGQNGQQFRLDSGKVGKRQLGLHGAHYFTMKTLGAKQGETAGGGTPWRNLQEADPVLALTGPDRSVSQAIQQP